MFNREVLESIFEKLLSQAKKSYDEFNAADATIGDGDLGITILNGLEEINNNINNFRIFLFNKYKPTFVLNLNFGFSIHG